VAPDVSKEYDTFKRSATKNPVTGHHVPEDLNPHFNPLNTQLNPICHLLALLGAHHILHVSRIRDNSFLFFLFYQNKIHIYKTTYIGDLSQ
jgi:hypothetical protein